jgi:hypothetical protein
MQATSGAGIQISTDNKKQTTCSLNSFLIFFKGGRVEVIKREEWQLQKFQTHRTINSPAVVLSRDDVLEAAEEQLSSRLISPNAWQLPAGMMRMEQQLRKTMQQLPRAV